MSTDLTEGSFGSILLNENGVILPLMTDFVASFFWVDGAFKSSANKLCPRLDMLPWKTTEYNGYHPVQLDA